MALASSPVFANNCSLLDENCDENEHKWYRYCVAKDANGEIFKYYMSTDFFEITNKKQALKKCQAESSAPKTCKVTYCVEY
jgi:hypothetical protein